MKRKEAKCVALALSRLRDTDSVPPDTFNCSRPSNQPSTTSACTTLRSRRPRSATCVPIRSRKSWEWRTYDLEEGYLSSRMCMGWSSQLRWSEWAVRNLLLVSPRKAEVCSPNQAKVVS